MADMARAISDTERTPEALAGVCILSMVSASLGKGSTSAIRSRKTDYGQYL